MSGSQRLRLPPLPPLPRGAALQKGPPKADVPSSGTAMLWRCIIGWFVLTVVGPTRLSAGFAGDYEESRWTLKTYGGDGSVDWLGDSFLLESGFSGSGNNAQVDLTVRATRSGTIYFDWIFYGDTASGYRLSWLRNASASTLANRKDYDEGSASAPVTAGDTVGFRLTAPIDEFPAMAEISAFFAPGQEPGILVPPAPQVICNGGIAVFSVLATNDATYQWQFKGQNLPDEVFADLVLRAVPPADAGTYRVIVSNPLGSVTSPAAPLTIPSPPIISTQPLSQATRCAGQSVTATITASGSNLRYQWRRNGLALAGATGPSLTLSNLAAAASGQYTVLVSNSCGILISAPLALSVLSPPTISVQPQSQSRYAGEGVTFSAAVADDGPVQCQWRRNGTNLAAANQPTLTLSNLQVADAGLYSVIVSNGCGATTSVGAALTVVTEPPGLRIVRGKNREVNIEVSASIGRAYILEASADSAHWAPVITNWLVISGTPLFYDVANLGVRIYRVRPAE